MGTKNDPGDFDCYANAEPDEPMFVLLARDPLAAQIVREWVMAHHKARVIGAFKMELDGYDVPINAKEDEALDCADAMDTWRATRPVDQEPTDG